MVCLTLWPTGVAENYSEKGGPIIPGSTVEPYLLLHFEEQVLLSAFLVGSTGLIYFNLDNWSPNFCILSTVEHLLFSMVDCHR